MPAHIRPRVTHDEVLKASIFKPRTGPAEDIPAEVRESLSLELGILLTYLLTDAAVELRKAPYATNTVDVTHTYRTLIAKRGGGVVAWLGESRKLASGAEMTVPDSLSLNGPQLLPDVREGSFIFRGGHGFNTQGDIDFWPSRGGSCEHESGKSSPVIAATAPQLVALTTELEILNQTS